METMQVETPRCCVCGKTGTLEVSAEEYVRRVVGQMTVQDAFPNMSPALREQIVTGTHPACWDEMFRGEEDETETPA